MGVRLQVKQEIIILLKNHLDFVSLELSVKQMMPHEELIFFSQRGEGVPCWYWKDREPRARTITVQH